MNINQKVGMRIRKIRQKAGISQEHLAYLAGIDRSYVSDIELGKRNVSLVILNKLAIALEVKIKAFFL